MVKAVIFVLKLTTTTKHKIILDQQMNLQIKLFATLKDLAGSQHVTIEVQAPATIDDVKVALSEQFEALAPALSSAIAAVNQEYVFSGYPISADDEIAFFPPVSGGRMDTTWPEVFIIAEAPIDLNQLSAQIVRPETGAVALFSGYVRGKTIKENDKTQHTTRLEYEAYAPMAESKMQQVAKEIRQQWPLVQGIAIVQRVGSLQVGEPTVLIACAAGHRDQGCFEAARYGIDRLKEIVPVWKKEIGDKGQTWVEGDYHPTPDDAAPE